MATRQIPWARIFAEGFAIVVSILLAFGIQAWWDARQERVAEAEYLAAIHDEIERNLSGLEGNIDVAAGRNAALERAAALLDSDLYVDSAKVFIESVVLGSLYSGPPRVSTAVFDELANTGRIVIIRDLDLRREILELYARTRIAYERMEDDSNQKGSRLEALVVRHVPPTAIRRGPMPNDYSVDPASLSPGELAAIAESIAEDPSLLGEMRAAFSDYRDSNIIRVRQHELLSEVRDLLAGSLS